MLASVLAYAENSTENVHINCGWQYVPVYVKRKHEDNARLCFPLFIERVVLRSQLKWINSFECEEPLAPLSTKIYMQMHSRKISGYSSLSS